MKTEYIKAFAKELNKFAFFGSLLKPTFGKALNTVFGGMSLAGASSSAKQAGNNLGKTAPLPLSHSQNLLKSDPFVKPIGRTSI
jgi:hypothetical protein